MRWFRGRAEKQFKNKYRTNTKPAPAEAPKPKYKSPAPTKRVPKLRKPMVHRPFVDAKLVKAYSGPIDQSVQALRQIEAGSIGVRWVNESGSDGCEHNECANLAAQNWGSVEEFLASRKMAYPPDTRPSAGVEMGIYGHSHPGCDCHVIVTMENGSTYEVGPEDTTPRMINGPQEQDLEPGAESALSWSLMASVESVEDELGSYEDGQEEETFW